MILKLSNRADILSRCLKDLTVQGTRFGTNVVWLTSLTMVQFVVNSVSVGRRFPTLCPQSQKWWSTLNTSLKQHALTPLFRLFVLRHLAPHSVQCNDRFREERVYIQKNSINPAFTAPERYGPAPLFYVIKAANVLVRK